MRPRIQHRLRLGLTLGYACPVQNTSWKHSVAHSPSIIPFLSSGASAIDLQSRVTTTSTARLALATSAFVRSRLQWSQLAHQRRDSPCSSQSIMAMDFLGQVRSHAGHSHGHHHHDNTFLTSKNKDDSGVKITRIGLYVNLGMAIGKGIGGYAFNSQA